MEAVRLCKVVEKDGEILLTGLPCKKGQHVGMILLFGPPIYAGTLLDNSPTASVWINRALERSWGH